MAGAQTFPRVSVIVLVEQEIVPPVGVGLKFLALSETRSLPILITRKNFDHALCNFPRHGSCVDSRSSVRRSHREIRTEGIRETEQRMNQKVGGWKPNWASPV